VSPSYDRYRRTAGGGAVARHFVRYLLATLHTRAHSFDTWIASSLVGTRINPCTLLLDVTERRDPRGAVASWRRVRTHSLMMGTAYDMVFPFIGENESIFRKKKPLNFRPSMTSRRGHGE